MEYDLAKKYADELVGLLEDKCIYIEIAGGVRRHKPEPHDIEIVLEPKEAPYFQAHMLKFKDQGYFAYGNPSKNGAKAPFGTKYYRIKYKDQPLDVFVVTPPANFYVVYLIRTGDAIFSHSYMNELLAKKLHCVDGRILDATNKEVEINSEDDCFKLIGKEWIAPEKRIGEIKNIQ